ncbi:MAG: ribose-phosphate pyrophosphokinase [Armatimonadetes bacterium]|nr:ribose-phosphate pyrophosphokinase [Armatimonadota bacterium]
MVKTASALDSAHLPAMKLFAGSANPALAEAVAANLGIALGGLQITRFADGELYINLNESVRGADVFLLQPTCPPIDQHLLELLVLIDALKRASAGTITCVLPYYGYGRQEKKDAPREPITAKLIANLLTTAGATQIVAMDLHADAIQGFFDIPLDHLTALHVISDYLAGKDWTGKDIVVVSPDEGRVKKVRRIAGRLGCPLAVGYKTHPEHGVSEITQLAGDVRGKTCIVYDDMISSGGSINEIVDALLENGAKPEITVATTHALLVGKAMEKLSRPEIAELIITDTIPLPDEKRLPKIKQLSVAPMFAAAIRAIWSDGSVSRLFDF